MSISDDSLIAVLDRVKHINLNNWRYVGPSDADLQQDPVLKQLWEQYAVYATLKGIPI